jgi:hypothetical protein
MDSGVRVRAAIEWRPLALRLRYERVQSDGLSNRFASAIRQPTTTRGEKSFLRRLTH